MIATTFTNTPTDMIAEAALDLSETEVFASFLNAKRIQDAILQPIEDKQTDLGDSFIYYKPKDIVSGDFYWSYQIVDQLLLAVGDCAGHGIGGGLLSIMGYTGLKGIVSDSRQVEPAQVLNQLDDYFHSILQVDYINQIGTIDISLCKIDLTTNELHYSGARNCIYILRGKEIIILRGDKHSIGDYKENSKHKFSLQRFKLEKGDTLYLFSDGYRDQIGGPNAKKVMNKNVRELIIAMRHKSMPKQKAILHAFIERWKRKVSQTDDICIMGYRH
jgi:serine phosphatase RsbU (regulator of sigma subunit)